MATKKAAAAHGLPTWEDESYYVVTLTRSVEYPVGSGRKLRAGSHVTLKGKVARQLEADIADALPVTY